MRNLAFASAVGLSLTASAGAVTLSAPYSTTTIHERAADWQSAELSGLIQQGEQVAVPAGIGSGMLVSAPMKVPAFDELVPSWNAQTGSEGSLTLEVRVQNGSLWSPWYSFGTWSAGQGRGSVEGQKDALGEVITDTLRLKTKVTTLQYRLTLRGGSTALRLLALNTSERAKLGAGFGEKSDHAAWGKLIDVPQRSQMLYPDGGEAWCSPTSVSMILAKYGTQVTVPQAAAATHDAVYEGTGNWAFNVAYAGELGLRSFVTRLPSLSAAEKYIAAGVPLAVSVGWKKGELAGAALTSSTGHLMVLVGFDEQGNPILNDPAAPTDETVRRSYPRVAFEKLWLAHSGGLSYVMTPAGVTLPQ